MRVKEKKVTEQKVTDQTDTLLPNLGQALAPTLPVWELSQNEFEAIRIAKQNFCWTTLARITTICEEQYQCTTKTRARTCACLACFLSSLLLRLPEDILSEHIPPLILSSPIQQMSIIFSSQTSELIEALKKYPARDFRVSCGGVIFESRFVFNGTSYITGLYNEELSDLHLWPQLLPTINNTFARRVLTLTACKLLRRFRPRRGIVLFLSKRICVKSSSRTHPFEASTMRFVEDNTSIPVPKVYCSFVHNGRTYIVMERIQGEMLARVWKSRSTESQTKILEQLKKFTQELRSLAQLDTVGVTNVDGGLLYDIRLGSQRFGPFQTVQEFHSFLRGGRARALGFDPEIDQMMERQDGPWPPPIFTHGDLSSLNILVRGDEVVGIVDWETAGWYPSYWEYATACQVNIRNFFWREQIDSFLEPMPEELAMDQVRQRYFGDI
ncbi:kinase-like protein [Venturia nashicola]|uniref:Kinase-like protein n=1 Tax=Venturia nashicola TaxID=86259 RepID=A0A4Z1NWE1_9PEZI|nr:kinase-like protein [Venturia nashicola]